MDDIIIAVGPPPLTQEAADRSIDVIDFMAAAVRGVDLIDVTPTVQAAWRARLASYYPTLQLGDRYWFANAPYTYAAIASGWPQLPEMERNLYRQAWAVTLPGLLQFIDPALHAASDPLGLGGIPGGNFANMGSNPAPAGSNQLPQQQSRATSSDNTMSGLINQIHSKQQQEEQEAMQSGGTAYQAQIKAQNDAANMQMLTNMSQMRFQSMMAVAKNMKF